MHEIEPPDPHDENDPEAQNEPRHEDRQQDEQQDKDQDEQQAHNDGHPTNEQDAPRPAPLTPGQAERILDAVTRGMSLRAVAADPNIRGTFEQVRRVVRRARQANPRFEERLPKRSWRPAPVDQTIAVLDSDAPADELTPPAVFVDAGVPAEAVRISQFATSPTDTIHLFRLPDGTVIPVRVESRERRPARARGPGSAMRKRAARRQWRPIAAGATALLVVLIALLVAASWKALAEGAAPPPTAVERVKRG